MQDRLDRIRMSVERFAQPGVAMEKLDGLHKDADNALQDERKKPGGGDQNVKQKLEAMLGEIGELMETMQQKQGKGGVGGP
jgi:hypothetical protein